MKGPAKRAQHRTSTGSPHSVFVVDHCWHRTNKVKEDREESSESCISSLHLGLNISIKLNERLIYAFESFFSSLWAVWSVFLQNHFWQEAVTKRKRVCFSGDGLEKYKVLQFTCRAIVQPFQLFVFATSLFPSPFPEVPNCSVAVFKLFNLLLE